MSPLIAQANVFLKPALTAPLNFTAEAPPSAAGMTERGVRRIVEVFEGQIERGLHPGAQLVVLRRGQVVVDRAAGLADVRRGILSTPDIPFQTFSFSKMFTGLCVHRLIEDGKLELDAPIANYWPEFGCNGKATATIRHALLHQVGIPLTGLNRIVLRWQDWEWVTKTVAGFTAEYPPGARTAYHLVNYGFILGEVIRRVSGMPVNEFLRETFLEPLNLQRTSMTLPPGWKDRHSRVYSGHWMNRAVTWQYNRPTTHTAVVPGGNLFTTARDVAVLLQMLLNGGEYAGRRVLKPDTVAAATALGYEGMDDYQKRVQRYGLGFHLGGQTSPDAPPWTGLTASQDRLPGMGRGSTARTFGHFGLGTCLSWADPPSGLVVVFTCNRILMSEKSSARCKAISDAVWEAMG